MRLTLCIIICKFITFVCKLFKKNGTVYPGYIIYDILYKKVLTKVKYPKYVIAVTGSSGKGSTTELINHILKTNGYDVIYNASGSNGVLAATTLILNNCNIFGKFKHDVLLLECDERHLKLIFEKEQMSHLIITNITRDQPSRNGHANIVFNDIKNANFKNAKVILNADDPLVNTLKYELDNTITYGVDKFNDSYTKINLNAVDFQYCPLCNKKLKYKFYHYGHIGKYECNYCNFKHGDVDYEVTKLDFKKQTMLINKRLVLLNKNALYAAYYTVAAYALCKELGVSEEGILKALNDDMMTPKRGKEKKLNNRDLIMLETKNENALSYYQSLKIINNDTKQKSVIIGFDNVSRRYNYNDLSWLYDVEFELLNDKSIDKIILVGRFRYDVATRLAYANIPSNKIILVDDLNYLIDSIKETKGTIYTMVCFDMTAIINNLIEGEKNESN